MDHVFSPVVSHSEQVTNPSCNRTSISLPNLSFPGKVIWIEHRVKRYLNNDIQVLMQCTFDMTSKLARAFVLLRFGDLANLSR